MLEYKVETSLFSFWIIKSKLFAYPKNVYMLLSLVKQKYTGVKFTNISSLIPIGLVDIHHFTL
jgi:hypothetical protein